VNCPDLLALSQLLDAELPATPASAAVRSHAAACDACRERVGRLDRATTAARTALASREPPVEERAPAPGCLPPERIAAWAAGALGDADLRAAEAHLERCDACLDEGLAAGRMLTRLDAGPMAAVPDALRARVASLWGDAGAGDSLTAIVIRVARAGVSLLERHVVAPVVRVEELLVPAPAVRGGRETGTVGFRIQAPEARIDAKVVPEGDAVGLSLTLLGPDGRALPGQRVFLRRHGRSLYSARTDTAGALRLPRMEPGVYEVSCPGIGTTFRLDLRA
jgi:hypothetical protein